MKDNVIDRTCSTHEGHAYCDYSGFSRSPQASVGIMPGSHCMRMSFPIAHHVHLSHSKMSPNKDQVSIYIRWVGDSLHTGNVFRISAALSQW